MLKRLFILLCASLLGVVGAAGQNLPEPMSPPRLVNDFVGLLTSEQQNALEQKLEAFDRKTSTQIAVVAVDDLDGYAPGTMRSAFMTNGGSAGRVRITES